MHKPWKLLFTAAAILAICATPSLAQHYGFGMIKRTVTLERRLLPDVRLGNVSVAVVFPRGTGGLDGNLFSSDLETLIAQSGGGIRLVNKGPEYEIQCFTTSYQPGHITTKSEAPSKIFGKSSKPTTEREAHGNISLDARLIRISDGAVMVAFTETVLLNASSLGGGTTFSLPSIHVPGIHNQSQGPPSSSDPLADTDTDASLASRMLKTLALRVASHMVLMDEKIIVLLAQGGPLDEAARLAVNSRWSEYLEKLSTITPPTDPADNAYFSYDLGVANEALGYAAGDPKSTLKYLQESSIDYTEATEAKPAEKYFLEPQKRIETAITRYTKLADEKGTPQTSEAPRMQPQPSVAAGEKLTNADIVKLVKAHLDKGLIANKIQTAPVANFDLSVDGLVALSQSGVPSDLIAVMTNRMQRPEAARPR